jgi:hypothetical protein
MPHAAPPSTGSIAQTVPPRPARLRKWCRLDRLDCANGAASTGSIAQMVPIEGAVCAIEPEPDPRTEDGKRLWRAADLAGTQPCGGPGAAVAGAPGGGVPGAGWAAYLADDAVRERCLDAIVRLGFALLREVPTTPGLVLDVAQSFGFVRETNYGRLFDVRVVADPANRAFTSRELAPHTDNPYRDPVPTLQLRARGLPFPRRHGPGRAHPCALPRLGPLTASLTGQREPHQVVVVTSGP